MGSLDSRIFRHVVDSVANGKMRAGDRIFEPQLSAQFEVSRTPVRQALSRLVQEGILERQEGRRGYIVPQITPEDMDQVFEAREAVEGQIAVLACRNAKEADVNHLLQFNKAEHKQFEKRDRGKYADINEGFHFYLCAMSNNKYLQKYYNQLFWRTQMYLHHLTTFFTRADNESIEEISEHSYIEHLELIEAIRSRDVVKAHQAAVKHVRSTRRNRIRADYGERNYNNIA